MAIYANLCLVRDKRGRLAASRQIAETLYANKSISYRARRIREQALKYYETGEIDASQQGKHVKIKSIIFDEHAQEVMKGALRGITEGQRIPERFRQVLVDEVFPDLPNNSPANFSEKTARRWMRMLGFYCVKHKKNYYVHGHERPEVVAHRELFLQEMFTRFIPRMEKVIDGENMAPINAPLPEGQKRVIFIVHDESIIYSNDATKIKWVEDNATGTIRPKTNGPSVMISGFLCECHDFQRSEDLPAGSDRTCKRILPGKNRDGSSCFL